MDNLTAKQRRAIAMIVGAEAEGLPISRLLRTAYSCKWCGWIAGGSADSAEARQALLLVHHEALHPLHLQVEAGFKPWRFAANHSTWYGKWSKQADFVEALEAARALVYDEALLSSGRRLKLATDRAAEALAEMLDEDRAIDRWRAAVAILDRADKSTADKSNQRITGLLAELRGLGDDENEE